MKKINQNLTPILTAIGGQIVYIFTYCLLNHVRKNEEEKIWGVGFGVQGPKFQSKSIEICFEIIL
jgi:hypothetical protein